MWLLIKNQKKNLNTFPRPSIETINPFLFPAPINLLGILVSNIESSYINTNYKKGSIYTYSMVK